MLGVVVCGRVSFVVVVDIVMYVSFVWSIFVGTLQAIGKECLLLATCIPDEHGEGLGRRPPQLLEVLISRWGFREASEQLPDSTTYIGLHQIGHRPNWEGGVQQ